MNDRVNNRRPRRVQVQYWRRGETHPTPGYTTNISLTGMFIATRSPLPPGTRLRVEILEGERGFIVEGLVAHARKVRGELIHLSQPGMGVRFLNVEELVRELLPAGHTNVESTAPSTERPAATPAPAPSFSRVERTPTPAAAFRPPPPRTVSAPPPSSAARSAEVIPTPQEGSGTFAVHFLGAEQFLEVYHRDITNGGLFVSTRYPGRIQETVSVELHPPFPGAAPVLVRARVVQRFEPSADGFGGANLLAGMGVELLDLPTLLEKLRPFVGQP